MMLRMSKNASGEYQGLWFEGIPYHLEHRWSLQEVIEGQSLQSPALGLTRPLERADEEKVIKNLSQSDSDFADYI